MKNQIFTSEFSNALTPIGRKIVSEARTVFNYISNTNLFETSVTKVKETIMTIAKNYAHEVEKDPESDIFYLVQKGQKIGAIKFKTDNKKIKILKLL